MSFNPAIVDSELEHSVNSLSAEFESALADFCLRCGAASPTEFIDNVEAFLAGFPQQETPSAHHFFDGLYSRETFVPGKTIFVTDTHETCHPLFLMRGIISVWVGGENRVMTLQAPCVIRTEAGTRRIVYAHTDTVGITVHAATETDPDEIRRRITSQRPNPLLTNH